MPCDKCEKKGYCMHCKKMIDFTTTIKKTLKMQEIPALMDIKCKYNDNNSEQELRIFPVKKRG